MYLASIVEVETVLCFLLLYETTALLRKKQCFMIDFQSSGSPTKLLFALLKRPYRGRSLRDVLLGLLSYTESSCIVLFKY